MINQPTIKFNFIFKACLLVALNLLFVFSVLADEPTPTLREKKTEEGYILNLKDLIKESKNKIERVDDKLKEQAKLRRNQQREEKAREYFENAKRLYDEGKFEDAQELWQKAIKITEHPEMKDYINQSVKKTSRQNALLDTEEDRRLKRMELDRGYSAADVEKAYQSAVSLYKQKKYLAAKEDFDKVEEDMMDELLQKLEASGSEEKIEEVRKQLETHADVQNPVQNTIPEDNSSQIS